MTGQALTRERSTVFTDEQATAVYRTEDLTRTDLQDLVFVHGWGLSPKSYQPVIDAIAGHGYRVHAPALPGFGGSDPLPDPLRDTYRRTADRVTAAVNALDLPTRLPVVGHSFGAGLAVSMAATHPDWVSSLALIAPIGGAGGSVTTWARLIAGLRHEVGHSTVGRALDAVPSLLRSPVSIAAAGVTAKHQDLLTAFHALVTAGVPVAVIAADHDEIVPIGKIADLPGLRLVPVHGTHGWLLDEPEECSGLVADALRGTGNPADRGG